MTVLHWLLLAMIPNIVLIGIAVRRFSASEFKRNGYVPFDYDALQAELDEEFSPVRKREGSR